MIHPGSDSTRTRLLNLALDVRQSLIQFVDVPAIDRPAVAALLARLTDANLQELRGTRATHGGSGIAHHSRVR